MSCEDCETLENEIIDLKRERDEQISDLEQQVYELRDALDDVFRRSKDALG